MLDCEASKDKVKNPTCESENLSKKEHKRPVRVRQLTLGQIVW